MTCHKQVISQCEFLNLCQSRNSPLSHFFASTDNNCCILCYPFSTSPTSRPLPLRSHSLDRTGTPQSGSSTSLPHKPHSQLAAMHYSAIAALFAALAAAQAPASTSSAPAVKTSAVGMGALPMPASASNATGPQTFTVRLALKMFELQLTVFTGHRRRNVRIGSSGRNGSSQAAVPARFCQREAR